MARVAFKLAALACGALAGAVLAQGAKVSSPVELARRADSLTPGQWVWALRIAPSGPVLMYVDFSRLVATIYRNGVRIGVSTVSIGKPGHATPTGVFPILEKNVEHHFNAYHNATGPMRRATGCRWRRTFMPGWRRCCCPEPPCWLPPSRCCRAMPARRSP